nr:hypothetical protein [Candidatus Hydrogenedentota bacterium]
MTIRRSLLGIIGLIGTLAICGGTVSAEVPHVKIGRFPQEVASVFTTADGLPSDDVRAVCLDAQGAVYAQTAAGWAVFQDGRWTAVDAPDTSAFPGCVDPARYAQLGDSARQVAAGPDGQLVAATSAGLMRQTAAGFEPLVVEDGLGRQWGTSDVRGV